MDTNILTKYYQMESSNIKKIIPHDQVGFTPGMSGWFNIWKSTDITYQENKKQNHNPLDFDKLHPFIRIKTYNKQRLQGNFLILIKGICEKLIANIMHNNRE